jgi:hypothetical protein
MARGGVEQTLQLHWAHASLCALLEEDSAGDSGSERVSARQNTSRDSGGSRRPGT